MMLSLLGTGCTSNCDSISDGPQTIGELGNGFFTFNCVSRTDPACDWTLEETVASFETFPGCLALNGEFGLDYTLQNEDALDDELDFPVLFVEPASEAYVQRSEPFVALQEGRAAMLARADEQVVDFIHFTIVEPDAIDFRELTGASFTTLEMAVNERRNVRVTPKASRCTTVGGSLPLSATSADESIVSVSTTGLLELTGEGLGTTTVTVELGLVQAELTVVIDEVAPDPTDTDSGSGTDGDTAATYSPFPLDATATEGGDTDTTGGDTDTDSGTDGTGTTGGAA
jgi:hypothetical protein